MIKRYGGKRSVGLVYNKCTIAEMLVLIWLLTGENLHNAQPATYHSLRGPLQKAQLPC